jgi:hypothetical protein
MLDSLAVCSLELAHIGKAAQAGQGFDIDDRIPFRRLLNFITASCAATP